MELFVILLSILGIASTASVGIHLEPHGEEIALVNCNETPLHAAVRNGSLEGLKKKVESADLYAQNCRGLTPMHVAILLDSEEAVTFLVEYKFDLRRRWVGGRTLLHFAAGCGALDAARALVHFESPVDVEDEGGRTPLHIAVERDDPDMVNMLIRAGADSSRLTASKDSFAELAVRRRASSALAALLDTGLSTVEARPTRNSAVRLAVIYNDCRSLDVLLNHKARMEARSEPNGENLLDLAVYLGHWEAANWLLEAGLGDPSARNAHGRTPLHTAAWRGKARLANLLLAWRADINSKDAAGRTPLWYARQRNHQALVVLLVERGGKV